MIITEWVLNTDKYMINNLLSISMARIVVTFTSSLYVLNEVNILMVGISSNFDLKIVDKVVFYIERPLVDKYSRLPLLLMLYSY